MLKTILISISLIAVSFIFSCKRHPARESADLVLMGGNVVTMNPSAPRAQAVAVLNGKIIAVGSDEDIKALKGPTTVSFNMKGRTILPGFIDAHAHILDVGKASRQIDLRGLAGILEMREKLAVKIAGAKPGDWIEGGGWDQNDWEVKAFPSRKDIDAVSPENPVVLRRIDGHAALLNSLALEKAGIKKDTAEPAGGKIMKDAAGEPTGILLDAALGLAENAIPQASVDQMKADAVSAAIECLAAGLTTVHDAGVSRRTVTIYRELAAAGLLKLRIYAMIDAPGPDADETIKEGPLLDPRITVRTLKFHADGALGSRGAALIEPYSDDAKNTGLVTLDENAALDAMTRGIKTGFQIATHAIGDRANRLVLDLYRRALAAAPEVEDPRLRIEHAQALALADIPRFNALGVTASMQPTHCTSDMPWAGVRLGPERLKGAYAWKSLLDAGVRICGGSDAPVESVKPLWGIYAAVTRQDHDGLPAGGWQPQERLSIDEALRLFTTDAAYASFEEKTKGSIEPGKSADLTVLSKDITKAPPSDILKTEVLMTIVGGEIAYMTAGF